MTGAVQVQRLGKYFRRYPPDRPATLQEAVLRGLRGLRPVEQFWALREISFSVGQGKMVGITGPNGSGKSTLLRLVGGVGRPDEGSVRVCGRVGALLELGAGFHPDLTGRENVFINGVISGLSRPEVRSRFDSIVDFAELEAFIDSPLRTYSTGMQMRLAFAIAAHIEPEVLLIDEVLAVGDVAFQEKCIRRIRQFKERGCTILLVSHDPEIIREQCDEALWLRAGRLAAQGPAELVMDQYLGERKNESERRTPRSWPSRLTAMGTELVINQNRVGSMEMELTSVRFTGPEGGPLSEIESGAPLRVEIELHSPKPLPAPVFELQISREDDFTCFVTSGALDDLLPPVLQGAYRVSLVFERLDLGENTYYLDLGLFTRDYLYAYDYHWHVYPLRVRAPGPVEGVLRPPFRWEAGEG